MDAFEIIRDKPPFWDTLKKHFPSADEDHVAVTYGRKIYCKGEMSEDLLAHELVHVIQQSDMGRDLWWEKYFKDSRFVYEQELEAYREQLKVLYKKYKDRNRRHQLRIHIAEILSGPLYNSPKTLSETYDDLKI